MKISRKRGCKNCRVDFSVNHGGASLHVNPRPQTLSKAWMNERHRFAQVYAGGGTAQSLNPKFSGVGPPGPGFCFKILSFFFKVSRLASMLTTNDSEVGSNHTSCGGAGAVCGPAVCVCVYVCVCVCVKSPLHMHLCWRSVQGRRGYNCRFDPD